MSADTFPNLFHAVFWLIYTHKGSLGVVSIGTSVYPRLYWITHSYCFKYAYLLWRIMTALGSWVFCLDLYLLKQSISCSASKEDFSMAEGEPVMQSVKLTAENRTGCLRGWTKTDLSGTWSLSLSGFDVMTWCFCHIFILFPCVKDFSSVPVFLLFFPLCQLSRSHNKVVSFFCQRNDRD